MKIAHCGNTLYQRTSVEAGLSIIGTLTNVDLRFRLKTTPNKILEMLTLANAPKDGPHHRVGRVLAFSPVVGIGTPYPSPAGECVPPFWFRGEGHTRWRERVWESHNSDEGTYTVVLFIYMYFVALTYSVLSVMQKDLEQIFLLLLENLDNRFNKVKTDFSRTIANRNAIPYHPPGPKLQSFKMV